MTTTIGRTRNSPAGRRRARSATPVRIPANTQTTSFLVLLACVVVLELIGLVMVLSASSVTAFEQEGSSWYYFSRQLMWVSVGFVAMFVALRVDYRRWRRFAAPLMGISLVLLVAVLFVGREVNGAQRWIGTSSLSVQPSEFAKLALILFTANLLALRSNVMNRWKITMAPVGLGLGVFGFLVMLQPNMGTTLLMVGIVFTMLFVGGSSLRSLGVVALGSCAGGVALALAAPYRVARLTAAYDPWSDPLNSGYQTIQSLTAIANGGVLGRGLGEGRAKWNFLPEAHTDFIYAIIAEELGLVGALLVLMLILTFAGFGLWTAYRAPDRYGMLVAAGITGWIILQSIVNLGAVVGILPITGVPLPFVSFGGSAMVVTMFSTGMLLNVARQVE